MPICTHEEADTRIIVHLFHSVRRGKKKILIRTVDTDILVILLGEFDKVRDCSLFIGSTGLVFRGTGQGLFLMLPSTGHKYFFVFLWYGT